MNLVRDPFYPNRSVTTQVPQNPLRPFWSGSGYAPVAPRIQQSAGPGLGIVSPTDNVFYSKGGPARMDGHVEMRTRPSGSVLRAGRYLGAVAQRVGPSNEGQVLRTLAAHRAVGFNGLGSTTSVACGAAGAVVTGYGAGTQAGLNFSDRDVRAGVGAGVAVVGALAQYFCPRPGAPPAPAAAPPPAYGSSDVATLLLIAQQQAAADRAAASRSAEKSAADALAAKTATTKYVVVGGVAIAAIVAAIVLL